MKTRGLGRGGWSTWFRHRERHSTWTTKSDLHLEALGGLLRKQSFLLTVVFVYLLSWKSTALAQNEIPRAAWRRPIGLPLENSGIKRVATDIDDGDWQGAPGV